VVRRPRKARIPKTRDGVVFHMGVRFLVQKEDDFMCGCV
jgi:hypothetical protein